MRIVLHTSKGEMNARLFEEETSDTVRHFMELVQRGFYNGLRFFKYEPDMAVQTGCPENSGIGNCGYHIPTELKGNEQRHRYGSMSFASAAKDTVSSQFFICLNSERVSQFDGHHCCFGKVEDEDLDVLKKLRKGDILEHIVQVQEDELQRDLFQ